jgi:hypothetical protein
LTAEKNSTKIKARYPCAFEKRGSQGPPLSGLFHWCAVKYADIRTPVIEQTGKDPYVKWISHRGNAKKRGIAFELTFEQWWSLWEPHFAKRGTSRGKLVMCRTGDQGPYALGNVRIATGAENIREGLRIAQRKAMQEAWSSEDGDNFGAADWLHDRMEVAAY